MFLVFPQTKEHLYPFFNNGIVYQYLKLNLQFVISCELCNSMKKVSLCNFTMVALLKLDDEKLLKDESEKDIFMCLF